MRGWGMGSFAKTVTVSPLWPFFVTCHKTKSHKQEYLNHPLQMSGGKGKEDLANSHLYHNSRIDLCNFAIFLSVILLIIFLDNILRISSVKVSKINILSSRPKQNTHPYGKTIDSIFSVFILIQSANF